MLMTYALGMYGTVAQSSPFGSTCPPNGINQNKKSPMATIRNSTCSHVWADISGHVQVAATAHGARVSACKQKRPL
jgi:hypothetical protein